MHGYNKCFHFSNEFCVWKSNPSAARRQQNGWQGLCLTRCMDTCACVNSCPQIRAICNMSLEEQIWKYISYLISITHFCCQLSRWDYCNSWENYDNRKVLRENRYLLNASITQWCGEQVGGCRLPCPRWCIDWLPSQSLCSASADCAHANYAAWGKQGEGK